MYIPTLHFLTLNRYCYIFTVMFTFEKVVELLIVTVVDYNISLLFTYFTSVSSFLFSVCVETQIIQFTSGVHFSYSFFFILRFQKLKVLRSTETYSSIELRDLMPWPSMIAYSVTSCVKMELKSTTVLSFCFCFKSSLCFL